MKRVQLFEFEDYKWFSSSMRASLTRLIVVLHNMLGIGKVLADLIGKGLRKTNSKKIVDLGSGSGGSMVKVMDLIRSQDEFSDVEMTLTDLYPDKNTVERFSQLHAKSIRYHPDSVDATHLEKAPKGLKTMINSFHHMSPDQAKQILSSASKNKEAILIYEMAENKIPLAIWWLMLPVSLVVMIIMVIFMTPFVRPLTFHQLFFTYIIPVIPICYAWDGQASMPRIYALSDIDELLEGIETEGYTWEKGSALKENGKPLGYYVLGVPE
ncbi:MAG: hypothetical protein QNK23_13320 [Crocinitomicaceae bacterium]|nr:hypothetical protein [Crocinitomicaceae bacterium]